MFISQKEKIFFIEQLFLILKGGMPISEALEVLKEEAKSRAFKKALDDILKRVLEGESLSESFKHHPKIFDNFFQNIIKIGEKSGTLEENLKYLSTYLSNYYSLGRKVKSALIYPAIIIVLAVAIALVVAFFVLPKIINVFKSLGITQLPLATRLLMGSADFLQKYWYFLLGGIILIFFFLRIIQRIKIIKFYFHKTSLFLPIYGQIVKNLTLAKFSRTFYTLLKSGVPILESFDIFIDTMTNEAFKRNLILVRAGVERGEKISQNFKKFPRYFPPVFSEMILVGEKSGSLEDSLLYLTEFYEREVDTTLKDISNLIEPVLLILVGILVCFVTLAIIVPIYNFTGSLRIR